MLLRHESDHLRVFFIMYAVFFAHGLTRMVAHVYNQPSLDSIVALVTLTLIGLRLIFSPEALSEYLLTCQEAGCPAWPKAVVLWHYPVLLAQAAALFLACYQLERSGATGPGASIVWSAAVALGINTAWLVSRLLGARGSNVHGNESQGPRPAFWITNNVLCVLLAELALLLAPNGVLIALAILLANSVIDLYVTAESYIPQTKAGT